MLLCMLALPLFAVGGDGVRIEPVAQAETPAWDARKRSKGALVLASRLGAECPLVAAVQVAQARVSMPDSFSGFRPPVHRGRQGAMPVARARQPLRPPVAWTAPGVVRLLI